MKRPAVDFPGDRLTQLRYVQFRRAANGDVRGSGDRGAVHDGDQYDQDAQLRNRLRTVVQDLGFAGSITT